MRRINSSVILFKFKLYLDIFIKNLGLSLKNQIITHLTYSALTLPEVEAFSDMLPTDGLSRVRVLCFALSKILLHFLPRYNSVESKMFYYVILDIRIGVGVRNGEGNKDHVGSFI